MSPISQPRAARTVRAAIALKEFVQITGDRFTDIGRQYALGDRSRDARGIEPAPRSRVASSRTSQIDVEAAPHAVERFS